MLKLLHAADVHLDSAFSGLNSRTAELRRSELRAAFSSMMTHARMTGVDLLLLSGDLFDGNWVTRETVRMLCREFESFARPVFIAPGNHDPATPTSVWRRVSFPENVHIFTEPTLSAVELPELGAVVYGFGFPDTFFESVPIEGMRVEDPTKINLLVAHCDLTSPTSEDCPITPAHLTAFGADYAALGHIHNPSSFGPDNRWAYSGCLEGRRLDEVGPKGAIYAEIEKTGQPASTVELRRVRFSRRRLERGELDVTGAETTDDVREAIGRAIRENGWGEDTFLMLRLTGAVAPTLVIDTETLEAGERSLFLLRLEDGTHPDVDPAALAGDPSIRGAVYRQLRSALESDDEREREVARRALRYAICAIRGDTV